MSLLQIIIPMPMPIAIEGECEAVSPVFEIVVCSLVAFALGVAIGIAIDVFFLNKR